MSTVAPGVGTGGGIISGGGIVTSPPSPAASGGEGEGGDGDSVNIYILGPNDRFGRHSRRRSMLLNSDKTACGAT